MANSPSVAKQNRKRLKKRAYNLLHLVKTRTAVKKAASALAHKSVDTATLVHSAAKQLDHAAQKGILKKKTASRKVSRLMKALNRAKA